MNRNLIIVLGLATALGCKSNYDSGEELPQAQVKGGNAELIRNPESADGQMDTINVATITLDHSVFEFDTIKAGKVLSHRFPFTNTGSIPLIITDVKSSCGCTVPDWPKEPILPGQSSTIVVEFNSTDKYAWQSKPVTIISNAYPKPSELLVHGFVIGMAPKE